MLHYTSSLLNNILILCVHYINIYTMYNNSCSIIIMTLIHIQMNWRTSVDIMKSIILFYNKAKAYELLAAFFDSCAQV